MIASSVPKHAPIPIPSPFARSLRSASHQHPLLSSLDQKCRSLLQLRQIQCQMLISGLLLDPFFSSRLIAFCAISPTPHLAYARSLLSNLHNANLFSWNVTIRGFSGSDAPHVSLYLYKRILVRPLLSPDHRTFPFLLKACGKLGLIGSGNTVFGHVLKRGHDSDSFVVNALIHMFAACGAVRDARKVFDKSCVRDLVSWNTLINVYAQRGCLKESMDMFAEMEREEVEPDEVTLLGIVSCCAQLGDLELGQRMHRFVRERGLVPTLRLSNALMDMYIKCGALDSAELLFGETEARSAVTWTTMIAGYAKFGLMDNARKVFDEMPQKDVFPWNALLGGYVKCNQGKDVIALFREMQATNVKPDEVTMVTLLSASSQLGALDIGMWAHNYIKRHDMLMNVALGTALVDMYSKCGHIEKAIEVFSEIPERNALTWTAIICGLASHGLAEDAIEHFLKMIQLGFLPDEVTFIGVLSACCHAGRVDEGRAFFNQMITKYKLQRKQKHYSCMVDLLGRSGRLDEAEELVKTMPMEPDTVTWGALFFACRMHGHVPMGERAAKKLLELEPSDSGIYVLLASMYLEANMREEADKVRAMMGEMGVQKTPGCSSIELDGIVHEFIVRDKSHPTSTSIYGCLTEIHRQMKLPEMKRLTMEALSSSCYQSKA